MKLKEMYTKLYQQYEDAQEQIKTLFTVLLRESHTN